MSVTCHVRHPHPLNSPPKCQARGAADTHPFGSPIQQYASCRIRVAHVSRSPITSQPRVAGVSCVTQVIQCFGAIRAARLDAGMRWGSELIPRDCGHSSRRCYSSSLARCQDAKGFNPQRPIARESDISEWGRSMARPSRLDAGRGVSEPFEESTEPLPSPRWIRSFCLVWGRFKPLISITARKGCSGEGMHGLRGYRKSAVTEGVRRFINNKLIINALEKQSPQRIATPRALYLAPLLSTLHGTLKCHVGCHVKCHAN